MFGVNHDERWVRRSAATPHPCSGPCCGNPRRWFGEETMQERRSSSVDDWRARDVSSRCVTALGDESLRRGRRREQGKRDRARPSQEVHGSSFR